MASATLTRPAPASRRGGPLAGLRRPAVLIPLAVTLLAALWMAAAPADQLARTLPQEDAFYALAVAREAALGHGISADGIEHTNGFQPLWVALNVPLYALTGGDRIAGLRLSQLLSTVLWLGFVALLALQARALARRHGARGDVAAAVAAIVAGGSVGIFRLFHNGLETGLTLVLLAAAVLVLDRWERWSARRVLLAGLLLGALAWARIDEVGFAVALAAVAVAGAVRAHAPRRAVAPLAACALAAVVLVPWLAYNVSLDGSPMPSSGKAEGTHVDVGHNLDSALRAVGAWSAPPFLRPSMHYSPLPVSEALSILALALVVAAAVYVRRRRRPPLGAGTRSLIVFAALLCAWYVLRFGPWWFMERYLSPLLLLTVPWLATGLELARLPRRAVPALAALVLAANVPILVVLAGGPTWPPPAWAARDSNLGAHPNLNATDQLSWVRAHVRPRCVVGGFESGTMLYFRPNTVNLDGKVSHAALQAAQEGRSAQYVDQRHIDVLVDIESGIARALPPQRRAAWREVVDMGRYEAWVRKGREPACLTG